jgi:uroporphyrinogen-III synthase
MTIMVAPMAAPLANRRILVPESRELDLFAQMLEAQGATTLRCPMVAILDLEDPAPVEPWLRRLAGGGFDDLILLTGEGLRRILGIARRYGIEAELRAALPRLRTITRGPKPARVLRELGLAPSLPAQVPTTQGVIDVLAQERLSGRRIGVQLYPGNPNHALIDFLRGAGAEPDAVLPYRYASDAETEQVEAAIRAMAAGAIDAIAFTSSPQLQRLQEVAQERVLAAELRQGLARTKIAAIGPVVQTALEAAGYRADIVPEGSFHMKPLVTAICAALAGESTH